MRDRDAPEVDRPDPDDACSDCGAVLPEDVRFCEECGVPRSGTTRRRVVSAQEQIEVSERLRRAGIVIQWAVWMYRAMGVALVLWLTFGFVYGGVDGPGIAIVLAGGLVAIALFAGSVLVRNHPYAWSIGLASVVTLASVLALLSTGNSRALAWAITAWTAVPATASVRRILQQYPDVFAVREFKGELRGLPHGATVQALRQRVRQARNRTLKAVLLWGGGTFVACGVIVAIVVGATAPPTAPAIETELMTFAGEWNAADWRAVGNRFDDAQRERMTKGLAILLKRKAWEKHPPRLGEAVVPGEVGRRVRVSFPTERGTVLSDWAQRGGRWVLTGVKLPE